MRAGAYLRSPKYLGHRSIQWEQTQRKDVQIVKTQRRGRPRLESDEARSNRVVTFVTDRQLEALDRIVEEEDRSLSAVVHRIIASHFEIGREPGEPMKDR